MRIKKVLLLAVCLAMSLSLSFCGGKPGQDNSMADISQESYTSPDLSEIVTDIFEKYDTNGDGNVTLLMLGNSYTYSGELPMKLKSIAVSQGLDLKILTRAIPSHKLYLHLEELPDYPDYIEKADIVILQDYAGYNSHSSIDIPLIQALFGENILFYFYPFTMQSEWYAEEAELLKNIEFIHTGDIFYKLLESYTDDWFIHDSHNNDLCSYIFAMAMYCKIFEAEASNIPYKGIISKNDIPGDSVEEKEYNISIFQQYVMESLEGK